MTKAEPLHFKTHAELKNVIGQDLINDDSIAIIELVKNGLDAGANTITVRFVNTDHTHGRIVVTDNGTGMTKPDIVDKWLNIAYSEKKKISVGGRQLAGNKGVGRFACDRLGSQLNMYTCATGGLIQHLQVDWSQFEGKDSHTDEIQSIDVLLSALTDAQYIEQAKQKKPISRGTRLVISRLRAVWDREKLIGLKRSLERFVDPNTAFDKTSVSITIIAPHLKDEDAELEPHVRVNGRIENQVLEKLKFKTTYLTSDIAEDGDTIVTALHHDGKQVYRVVERNEHFELLAGTSVVIHYMNPYKKAYFKRQTGLNTVEFGSMFLFLNGYRIPPYGDRDNDWLKLDNRKGQGTARHLGNRELLGRIVVRDTTQRFRVVSNREGVARSQAFNLLIEQPSGYFYSSLKRLERFVVSGLDWDSVTEETQRALVAGKLPGDGKTPLVELYRESNDSKKRRIALNVLKLIGASSASTLELEIDPELLETLRNEKEDEVRSILERFGDFGDVVDKSVQSALSRVAQEFERQKASLAETKKVAKQTEKKLERMTVVAQANLAVARDLKKQVKTQQTELLFSRLATGSDREVLMLMHHQTSIYANTVKNYLDRAIKCLQANESGKAIEHIEKAMLGTRRITAVANIATKANFRLQTDSITADLPTFIGEYVENVAKDGAAQNLRVTTQTENVGAFSVRFKPIDIAIVFDNLASNSTRAGAKKFLVSMMQPKENELKISVQDDGPGVSQEVSPVDAIFNAGVTTTSGSGLGLFHVKQTIEQMGGTISVDTLYNGGFGVIMRFFK